MSRQIPGEQVASKRNEQGQIDANEKKKAVRYLLLFWPRCWQTDLRIVIRQRYNGHAVSVRQINVHV